MTKQIVERLKKWRNDRQNAKTLKDAIQAISDDYGSLDHVIYTMFGDIHDRAIYDKSCKAHLNLFQNLWRKDWRELIEFSARLSMRHGFPVREYFTEPPTRYTSTSAPGNTAQDAHDMASTGFDQSDSGKGFSEDWFAETEKAYRETWEFLNTPQSGNLFSYGDMINAKRVILCYDFFQRLPSGGSDMKSFLEKRDKEDVKTIGEIVAVARVIVALAQASQDPMNEIVRELRRASGLLDQTNDVLVQIKGS